MKTLAPALLCALSLAACFKRGTREPDPTEAPTQVQTTVPDAGAAPVMPAPIAPIPVAVTDAGAIPVAPAMPGPNAIATAPDSSVAPGAVEPGAQPPAAPMPVPGNTAQPAPADNTAQPAQPAAGTAQPSTGTTPAARNTEVVNVPGVGAVRVRQGRDNTTVNVGGIRINLPGGR